MQAAPSFVNAAAQWLCKTPVRVSQAPPATNALVCFRREQSRRRTQACSGTRELAWLLLLCPRRGTCHCYRHCESELSSKAPVYIALADSGSRLHPMTGCCICIAVSVQSVSVQGGKVRTDLESCQGWRPPSAPYLWIAGLSTRASAESETLPSLYLQTGGASRACESPTRSRDA
jgi:hypothetical protein